MDSILRACARARFAAMGIVAFVFAVISSPAPAQELSLRQILSLAAAHDLGLPADDARAEAASALARQANVKPNPVLGVDLENFAATGAHGVVKSVETTLYYQQQFERGDKRGARVGVANADGEVARLRRFIRALDLFRQVQVLWTEAAIAEASIRIARDQLDAARLLRDEITRRVEAARDPLFAGRRADTQVAQAEIALAQAEIEAENAAAALSPYIGGREVRLNPTALETLAEPLPATPALTLDLALLEREREAATARIRLEQVRMVPDVTVRGGVRSFGIGDEVALVVGGSLPLGTNDTNRGNIERAEAERAAIEHEIAAARAARDRAVVRLRARLDANMSEIRRLDAEIFPKAAETLRLVREGFDQGAFNYIDVIEAQRVVNDASARRLSVLKNLHTERATLDRLTDRFADLIPPATETRP